MSPRTEKQYKEIRNEKRELILDVSMKLFANNGYENTSISQISKEAGISKGLLYNYFKSKNEVLIQILEKGVDEIMNVFDPNKDGVLEVEEMEFFIRENFRNIREHMDFWKLYFKVVFQEVAQKHIAKTTDRIYRHLMTIMIRYFRKMGFENPDIEFAILGSLLDGIGLGYILRPDIYPLDQIEEELVRRYCPKKNDNI